MTFFLEGTNKFISYKDLLYLCRFELNTSVTFVHLTHINHNAKQKQLGCKKSARPIRSQPSDSQS